jgi:glycine/D-amino acid oxidase-like deaminating enzyme
MAVVICGGGVIAACTAYFLSRRGIEVTVVERTGVANAASGKAGGFLALDWCAGTPLDALARRSFLLHARLPGEIRSDWGHRPMSAYAGIVARGHEARQGVQPILDWLSDGVVITERIGTPRTTAIVHPAKFTHAVMRAAVEQGVQLRSGRVTGIARRENGTSVRGVEIDGAVLEADSVVVCMGPWSILASSWLGLPPVFARLSPSLVYDTGTDVPAEALFLEYESETGEPLTVEVFPRADGSTHITALSTEPPLPVDPVEVEPEPGTLERLQSIAERLSPAFAKTRIIARQACFRPVTQDGVPLIGKVPRLDGAYVATGHNVWGILNAPATGEAMAELIVDGGARTVDLAPFDPARLRVSR